MEQQTCSDQSDVFAFLADPATHELREPVIRIDTHGAAVFLAGKNVYKVKRAVRFPFMDFSTLDKRRRACERELAVNKADAPGLYLGVVPISKDGSHLKFGCGGTIVEWAVHLRRFDESRTLDRLAERNELTLEIIAKLAGVVAASHRRAPMIGGANAGQALQNQIEETLVSLEAAPGIFTPQAVAGLRHAMQQAFARLAPLLVGARKSRSRPPLSWRSSLAQHRLDRRPAGLVRCDRIRRGDRDVRRALRSRVSSDGSVDARIAPPREPAVQPVFMDLR